MSRTDWSETKRARVEAAQRRRRIIFNDDTHELALEGCKHTRRLLGTSDRAARRDTGRHHLLVGAMRTVRCSGLRQQGAANLRRCPRCAGQILA